MRRRESKAVEKVVKITKKVSKKNQQGSLTEEQAREIADRLRKQMEQAFNDDRKANLLKKPALNKLMALDQVCRSLRQLLVQSAFLDAGGCT